MFKGIFILLRDMFISVKDMLVSVKDMFVVVSVKDMFVVVLVKDVFVLVKSIFVSVRVFIKPALDKYIYFIEKVTEDAFEDESEE